MRIDIVTDTFAPDVNGVSMTLGRLVDGLKQRGHRVHVIHTGQTAGPGAVIWQTASGVNESRFTPLVVTVPVPSTIALGVLGLGSLLLFRRRK